MTKIAMPTTGDELQEFLGDPAKVTAVFSKEAVKNGEFKEFLETHARIRNAKDDELKAQVQEQTQVILAEYLRDTGAQKIPPGLAAKAQKPMAEPGSVVRRQSLYNRSAHGTQLNGTFDTFGDFMRAVTQEGAGRQYRDGPDLNARLGKVKEIQNAFSTDVPSDVGFLI